MRSALTTPTDMILTIFLPIFAGFPFRLFGFSNQYLVGLQPMTSSFHDSLRKVPQIGAGCAASNEKRSTYTSCVAQKHMNLRLPTFPVRIASFEHGYLMSGEFVGSPVAAQSKDRSRLGQIKSAREIRHCPPVWTSRVRSSELLERPFGRTCLQVRFHPRRAVQK